MKSKNMDIETFRKRFKELTPIERSILKILAVAYESVTQVAMVSLLKNCGIRNEDSKSISDTQVKEYKELLDAGGWLNEKYKGEMQVAPKRLEFVMRMAVIDPGYKMIVQALQHMFPYRGRFRFTGPPWSFGTCLRELRIALYDGDLDKIEEIKRDLVSFYEKDWQESNFFSRFFLPFDFEWLSTFPLAVQQMAVSNILITRVLKLDPIDDIMQLIAGWKTNEGQLRQLSSALFMVYLQQGRFDEIENLIQQKPVDANLLAQRGCWLFFNNQNSEALQSFKDSLKLLKKENGQNLSICQNFMGIIQVLALLREKKRDYFDQVVKCVPDETHNPFRSILKYLNAAAKFQLNFVGQAKELLSNTPKTALGWVFYALVHYWNNETLPEENIEELKKLFHKAQKNGYHWIALELAALISRLEKKGRLADNYEEIAADLEEELCTESLLHVFQPTEKWERSLELLNQLQAKRNSKAVTESGKITRLVWWIDFSRGLIQPVEQSFGKNTWSKGRNVALKRLKEFKVDCMTEQDRNAARAIETSSYGYYGSIEYYFEFEKLMLALVGHPLLFLMENPTISVELIERTPQLQVEQTKNGYELYFSHPFDSAGVHVLKETPTRYLLLQISPMHVELNRLLDYGKLRVPARAKDKLIETIGNISAIVTVQSAIGSEEKDIPTIQGNPLTFVHLLPVGNGFKIEFFVKPFTSEPPYYKAGTGRENVISEINGTPTRAVRNLKKETENARKVENACPTLLKVQGENGEWFFDELEDCLKALCELEPLRQSGDIVVEHPKGEKLRIAGSVGFDQLSMGIRKERNWFEVSGKVRVNEELVMDFRKLLDLAKNTDTPFVEISDGQYLALTAQLKRKLEELNNLLSKTKNELRFHPLAIHAIEDFAGLLSDVEVDAAWKKQLTRLKESREIRPEVPSTFKAELRPYQREGFRWLTQMAHWGVGACLADDMGLGKTIQALALLLNRAQAGPAMVVAPASVVRNWHHETRKFAPTLNPIVFGGNDRQETIDKLQAFDLLLVSYGLLQQESDMLAKRHFTTIVLDEAQAIKNRGTKRSKAAMQLQADFRVITTGTPIENHLGELWNLFNFLNPGLLGSLDHFNETYAAPIERFQDNDRRNQLRRLIQPFILRRRKSDVLEELPEKTEVTLTVELSPEERAFYEALRIQAIERIENSAGDPENKRFQILAELMRLRQAACNPRMVQENSELPSSKLNLFAETVEGLKAEGHKALVFSQFVKHLKIIEEWVKQAGIPYQYLDGSTPLPQRDKAIRAFQAGEGDLFLISLKAGGFGLNLTAADYVLHLDPWWNPAVEDQASDRAHRIGQQRPVTIYRLVAEQTIEEKIVKLHADKRELADSLLEGTDVSGKLSAKELLNLIKS